MPLLTKSHVSSFAMTIRETVWSQQTSTQSLCYPHISPGLEAQQLWGKLCCDMWGRYQSLINVELSLFPLFSGRDGYWIQARRMQAYMPLKFTPQAEKVVCQAFNCCNHCLDQHLQRFHTFHNTWFCKSLWDGLCWLLYFTCAGFLIFLCCAQRDHLRPVITYPQHILLLLCTMLFQSLISLRKKMSIPAQLHWGVIKLFIFSPRVEFIHTSTLPMQI